MTTVIIQLFNGKEFTITNLLEIEFTRSGRIIFIYKGGLTSFDWHDEVKSFKVL